MTKHSWRVFQVHGSRIIAAAALPMLLLASACTGPSSSEPSPNGSKGETTTVKATTWKQVEDTSNDAPLYWAGENQVGITTYGSHDCYDVPTVLTQVDSHEAAVEWEPSPTGPCDGNIEVFSFHADLPDGVDTTKPIIISGLNGSQSSIELPVQQ